MEQIILDFHQIMSQLKEIHIKLLELSKKKQAVIKENSAEALQAIVNEEQLLVSKSSQLELKRQKCVDLLAKALKKNINEISIQDFINNSDINIGRKIKSLQVEMRQTLIELQNINEANKAVTQSKLDYVHFVVDSMTSMGSSQVYGSSGNDTATPKTPSRMYDRKV